MTTIDKIWTELGGSSPAQPLGDGAGTGLGYGYSYGNGAGDADTKAKPFQKWGKTVRFPGGKWKVIA